MFVLTKSIKRAGPDEHTTLSLSLSLSPNFHPFFKQTFFVRTHIKAAFHVKSPVIPLTLYDFNPQNFRKLFFIYARCSGARGNFWKGGSF